MYNIKPIWRIKAIYGNVALHLAGTFGDLYILSPKICTKYSFALYDVVLIVSRGLTHVATYIIAPISVA